MDYAEVHDIMEKHRHHVAGKKGVLANVSPSEKRLCNKTWLRHHTDGSYGLMLFSTEILTWTEGHFAMNDGGWFARTTFDRFNTYLPRGFKIHGMRVPLKLGTVAIVTTPDGTYPYNMPESFTYGGQLAERRVNPMYTNQALPALQAINAYVHGFLDRLFTRKLPRKFTPLEQSRTVATALLENVYSSKLLPYLMEGSYEVEIPPHIGLGNLLEALTRYGVCSTRTARSKEEVALQTELTLSHGFTKAELAIKTHVLRKALRKALFHYLITTLGFTLNGWNRR